MYYHILRIPVQHLPSYINSTSRIASSKVLTITYPSDICPIFDVFFVLEARLFVAIFPLQVVKNHEQQQFFFIRMLSTIGLRHTETLSAKA